MMGKSFADSAVYSITDLHTSVSKSFFCRGVGGQGEKPIQTSSAFLLQPPPVFSSGTRKKNTESDILNCLNLSGVHETTHTPEFTVLTGRLERDI